jgi:hypothetical protein
MIEVTDHGTTVTGKHIPLARMIALRGALNLEIKGFGRKGRSAYAIIKDEFKLKGNKKKVLEQFNEIIETYKETVNG